MSLAFFDQLYVSHIAQVSAIGCKVEGQNTVERSFRQMVFVIARHGNPILVQVFAHTSLREVCTSSAGDSKMLGAIQEPRPGLKCPNDLENLERAGSLR
jgi:hypothetical protein